VNAAMPSAAWQHIPPENTLQTESADQPGLRHRRRVLNPLTAVCAVQAALSLSLVWSNTASADEAQNLVAGRLEWAHWLRGMSVPPNLVKFSGSPLIYPPISALANSIGGLAGARILSLAFMLGATVLLYHTASPLFGRDAAVIGAALWGLSEPVLRLALATFDPLSVLLTALSAWFVVQAGYRRHRGVLVIAAAAAALALANVAAYWGILIDPVVIVFAFLVWLPRMQARWASLWTAWLTGALAAFVGLLMFVSQSWTGLTSSFLIDGRSGRQGALIVLNDSWQFSGLITALAVIGAAIAFATESKQRAALLSLLACAAIAVPVAQFYEQFSPPLDKHLAYGIWFAAMAAGYGCSRLIQWIPGTGKKFAALFCVIIFIYPTINSWNSAWKAYHSWPDARSFISAFTPLAARSRGFIDVSEAEPENIAEYYTLSDGSDWTRWNTALSLDPATVPNSQWTSYYEQRLSRSKYCIIVLFYPTTFSPTGLPTTIVRPHHTVTAYQLLLSLAAQNSGQPGLPTLTQVLATDSSYQLEAQGPYDSASNYGVFAVWQKVQA
jgi:Dolichyl-phosphate-mannose-protein mannosyltransferase